MSKIKSFLKKLLKGDSKIGAFIRSVYNNLPFNNRIKKKKHNKVIAKGFMKKCKINFRGKNNVVEIQNGAILQNCTLNISGNNNRIVFSEKSFAKYADLCTENNGNSITIGKRTNLCGQIHLAAIEGTNIIVGDDCLFSSGIVFRTGDSHSILDMNGNRTNPSKDIVIHNHVWIGHRVLVNKGVEIGEDNIIGTAAVVTKSILDTNSVIAGIPAKVVKTGINWDKERK